MAEHIRDYPESKPVAYYDVFGFTFRIMFSLLFIGTGAVFLLDRFGYGVMRGEWWVMYLVIVGVSLLLGAIVGYTHLGHLTSVTTGFIVFAALLFVLSAIFIWDPTWSFTRGWRIEFLRGIDWDKIWPLAIILVGVALLVPRWRRTK
jgi:hypothetical protein